MPAVVPVSAGEAAVEPATVEATAVETTSTAVETTSTTVETPSAAVPSASAPVRCVGEIRLAEDSRAQ
jgi:hypothetical protein